MSKGYPQECCKNCKFWDANGESVNAECRRYPPSGDYRQMWPITAGEWWCGEFELSR